MRERTYTRELFLPYPIEQVFAPFADAANLQVITPPWLHFRIISELPIEMREGAVIEYWLRLHGAPIRWRTVIAHWDPPYRFIDLQSSGPFALWHHTHTFETVEGGTIMRDRVIYRVGFGPIGGIANALLVQRDVRRIFDFREQATIALVEGIDAP
jgi:ligand-binding SRPBCC domain-containing protein